ncbi:hypothetical protein ACWEN6_13830 [Sphaerisporangium sp. NPDC004334]
MQIPPTVEAALRLAPPPEPFDLDEYLQQISHMRGRRLFIHPLPDAAVSAVCGLWLATDTADHIYTAKTATGLLRVNIVLHEVGHMLFDGGGSSTESISELESALGLTGVKAARSAYDTQEERDAELFARLAPMGLSAIGLNASESLRRLEHTLTDPTGGRRNA